MWPLPLVMSRGCFLRCLYRVMMISRPRELLSSDTNVRLLPSAFFVNHLLCFYGLDKKSIYNRLSRSLDMLVIPIILRNVLYTLIVRHAKRELRVALLSYPQSIICFLHTNHKSWLLRTLTNRFLQNQKRWGLQKYDTWGKKQSTDHVLQKQTKLKEDPFFLNVSQIPVKIYLSTYSS